jgi:hypothetical protein
MKYLYGHHENSSHLRAWAGEVPLVRAHFYFWNPGQKMQKTLGGLLRTLMYYVLQAHLEVVPNVCPGRWSTPLPHGAASDCFWTLKELRQAFTLFTTQCKVTTKFYFHIDGVDVYSGDCWEVIDTLQNLSTATNVKLCLSSRPWNEFQDAFGRHNPYTLQLHDLTREDIMLFARENLLSYTRFADFEPQLFYDLVHDVGEKAQGVFLWVRLAVRSLRDGITNCDPVSLLHERLRAIPSDLGDFFEQILSSVDKIYRTRLANTFIATLRSDGPLKMIQYYFLETEEATCSYELPASRWPECEVQRKVEQTRRRLNGRFKGLLEPTCTVGVTSQTLVDFLHRTLLDFLLRGQMRERLEEWAAQGTHVLTSISRALISESKFVDSSPSCSLLSMATNLAEQGRNETGRSDHFFAVLDQVELMYERLMIITTPGNCPSIGIALRAALSIGDIDYVRRRLTEYSTPLEHDRMLPHAVDYALSSHVTYSECMMSFTSDTPRLPASIKYCPSATLVRLLLEKGANPNSAIAKIPALELFLDRMVELMDGVYQDEVLDIFQALSERHLLGVRKNKHIWHRILVRQDCTTAGALRNTLRYFRYLFEAGFDPNADLDDGITGFAVLLGTLTDASTEVFDSCTNGESEALLDGGNLLREFFRYGADVTEMYGDVSGYCWLGSVCEELTHGPMTRFFGPSRNAKLEIFFQHGLDPNSPIPGNNGSVTVWTRLLEALEFSFRKAVFDRTYQQLMCRTVMLCVSYGADPYAERLNRLLQWMKGSDCCLSTSEVSDLKRAVGKEQTHVQSQADIRKEVRQATESRLNPQRPRKYNESQTTHESRRDNKRSLTSGHFNIRGAERKRRRFD